MRREDHLHPLKIETTNYSQNTTITEGIKKYNEPQDD